jgi:hypothetical protein
MKTGGDSDKPKSTSEDVCSLKCALVSIVETVKEGMEWGEVCRWGERDGMQTCLLLHDVQITD